MGMPTNLFFLTSRAKQEKKKDMAIIVKKFGGTSVGNIDLIRK